MQETDRASSLDDDSLWFNGYKHPTTGQDALFVAKHLNTEGPGTVWDFVKPVGGFFRQVIVNDQDTGKRTVMPLEQGKVYSDSGIMSALRHLIEQKPRDPKFPGVKYTVFLARHQDLTG